MMPVTSILKWLHQPMISRNTKETISYKCSKPYAWIKRCLPTCCIMLFLISGHTAKAAQEDKDTQTTIHLLDYIARDYPAAVQNGQVVNQEEYKEMLEFSSTVVELSKKIVPLQETAAANINPALQQLRELIDAKAPHDQIATLASSIRSDIIKRTGYKVTPTKWPDLVNGQTLYTLHCASCHGVMGNGEGRLALGMNPAPANFLNDTLMRQVSPFQAHNTIRLGIEGTAMPGFEKLSEEEVWDLAFYVKSLRFRSSERDSSSLEGLAGEVLHEVSFAEVATLSDLELLRKLKGDSQMTMAKLIALRLHMPDNTSASSLQLAHQYLQESLVAYQEGSYDASRQKALAAYLEGVEPVEAQLKAYDPAFTVALEQQMLRTRAAIENRETADAVQAEVEASQRMLSEATDLLQDTKLTFWLSFLLSASIMLREGLEAFLIIAVMLMVIRSAGIKGALPWIHGGWAAAVLLGFVGWYLSDVILLISGQDREIIEGIVALLAVGVLTYVGFWLHSNSHAKRWKAFIEEKVNKLVKAENMMGLAFFSFMVVFRETFESVLFLKAISLETAPEDKSSIGLGVVVAFTAIAVLMVLFIKYSQKIPVRQLFRCSAWMVTLLALILVGKGIHSIQESGFFSATSFPLRLSVEWLGVYPTVESILAQVVLFVIILGLWSIQNARVKLHN